MASRRVYVPPQDVPQYLTSDRFFNATSTGSTDSVMTQAPGSFYPGGGNRVEYAPVQDYNNLNAGSALPFATPIINNNASFQQDRNRGGLNPASANFQPGAYGTASGNAITAAALNQLNNNSSFGSNATTSSDRDSIASNLIPPYAQMDNSTLSNQYGGGVPLAPYSTQQPPNRSQARNDFSSHASSAYALRSFANTSNANFNGNQGFAAPQAPSFENLQAHNSYPDSQYQNYSVGNQGRFSQYQNQNQYSSQQAPQIQLPIISRSNMNRGNPGNRNTNEYLQRNANTSNLVPAPVYKLTQDRNAAPVRPSPRIQSPTPTMNRTAQSTQASSETHKHLAQTPTPLLRSRRGVDVGSERKSAATTTWIESPSNGGGGPGDSQHFRGSPPKIGGLNIGGVGNIVAKVIDPRTPHAATKLLYDLPKQATPFKNTGLVARGTAEGPTKALRALTSDCTGRPTIAEALNPSNMPFVEYCRGKQADVWGVIKISNIPYSVNRPEIIAFLGRNARITNDMEHEPVHIVMERVTSKTLDAYVEFTSFDEAVAAVNRFEVNRTGGRGGRLGQRHVEIELSSQDVLMKELFPKTKNVRWNGGVPIIAPTNPNDIYNSGFQGFISKEELVMLVKHVEAPQRSPFSRECPQRPFDCIISTLWKYPWYMVDYITIEDRQLLHEATIKLIYLLRGKLEDNEQNGAVIDTNMSRMLFKRLWRAALKCRGFSPSQKDDIIVAAGLDTQISIDHDVPPYAAEWKYLFALGPKPGVPYDMVFYYAALIREGTQKEDSPRSLADNSARGVEDQKLFGDLARFVDLPTENEEFISMTLGQVALKEWAGIEHALSLALT